MLKQFLDQTHVVIGSDYHFHRRVILMIEIGGIMDSPMVVIRDIVGN